MNLWELIAKLLHCTVAEENWSRLLDEIGAVGDEEFAPLMLLVHGAQLAVFRQYDEAGFVEQREHVTAAGASFAVGVHPQRDVGFADGAFGFGEG